jgi:hypothetical protein
MQIISSELQITKTFSALHQNSPTINLQMKTKKDDI